MKKAVLLITATLCILTCSSCNAFKSDKVLAEEYEASVRELCSLQRVCTERLIKDQFDPELSKEKKNELIEERKNTGETICINEEMKQYRIYSVVPKCKSMFVNAQASYYQCVLNLMKKYGEDGCDLTKHTNEFTKCASNHIMTKQSEMLKCICNNMDAYQQSELTADEKSFVSFQCKGGGFTK